MFDDIAAYYQENVVSAFVDYRELNKKNSAGNSKDLRFAINAASALFHLREHLPDSCRPSRAQVESLCSDYALLGDVVNAAKHKVADRNTPHGAPLVRNAKQINEQIVITIYEDDQGIYRYSEKAIKVKLSDKSSRNLLDILTNVLNFWEVHLHAKGLLTSARIFTHSNGIYPRTRKEADKSRIDLTAVRGVRFKQEYCLQRYDYLTKVVAPVDLTGYKIKGNIYKREPHLLDLFLTHNESGKKLQTTVTLTDKQAARMMRISDDEERSAFGMALPKAKAALRKLAIENGLVTPRSPKVKPKAGGIESKAAKRVRKAPQVAKIAGADQSDS